MNINNLDSVSYSVEESSLNLGHGLRPFLFQYSSWVLLATQSQQEDPQAFLEGYIDHWWSTNK